MDQNKGQGTTELTEEVSKGEKKGISMMDFCPPLMRRVEPIAYFLLIIVSIFFILAYVDKRVESAQSSYKTEVTQEQKQELVSEVLALETIHKITGGMGAQSIRMSPVSGIFEADMGQGRALYVTADGKHIFDGRLLESAGDEIIDHSNALRKAFVSETLKGINSEDMITFEALNEKGRVIVFTDAECPYCQRFHEGIEEMNEAGITVSYMAFPRFGEGSEGFDLANQIWCSDDPQHALTQAKAGEPINGAVCDESPVTRSYELGVSLGVSGTPYIFTQDGTEIPGLVPTERLLIEMGIEQ